MTLTPRVRGGRKTAKSTSIIYSYERDDRYSGEKRPRAFQRGDYNTNAENAIKVSALFFFELHYACISQGRGKDVYYCPYSLVPPLRCISLENCVKLKTVRPISP